jgi:cation transport ATPase
MIRWFVVQVAIPLFGPVVLSALFAYAWGTGQRNFSPRLDIIADVTPSALTFYSLALLSITLSSFWHKVQDSPFVTLTALLVAVLVAVYYSFTVVWRHASDYSPTAETYYVTLLLTLVTIIICSICERRRTG